MTTSHFTPSKLYFIIVALVAIIGLTIGYGTALYQYASLHLITDQEYIAGSYRDVQTCKQPTYKNDGNQIPKSQAEIDQCIQEMKTNTLARRSKESKENILGWLVRWSLFFVLFVIHFPTVLKYRNEE